MTEFIRQETLRRVQAGGSLYGELVEDLRKNVDAGARIEDGPLAVDFKALRSEAALPLRIIVSMSGLPIQSNSGPPPGSEPTGNIQSFISLLDESAGPERRRTILRDYDTLANVYQGRVISAIRWRREALYNAPSWESVSQFLSEAINLRCALAKIRIAGIIYRHQLPGLVIAPTLTIVHMRKV